jgi:hypothetical protein
LKKKWHEIGGYETGPTGVKKLSKAIVMELKKFVTFSWWQCSGCDLAWRIDVGE